ncbi:MAG: GNAT family N-acetyltransferase [Pseudomonadota bacterium]
MIRVRPIEAADEAQWRKLWRGYLTFYETERPEEIYASTFARLINPAVTDYHGFIADDDGQAVGLTHFIYHRHGWHIAQVCYLQDLFVSKSARKGGVGRRLMEAVFEAAQAAGAADVYWLTQDFNTDARALYDQIGTVTPFIKYRRAAP